MAFMDFRQGIIRYKSVDLYLFECGNVMECGNMMPNAGEHIWVYSGVKNFFFMVCCSE